MNTQTQVAISLLLLCTGGAVAQPASDRHPLTGYGLEGRLDTKELARARFAASRADVQKLAEDRTKAARIQAAERYKEFLVGRGTLDLLFESLAVLLKAEWDLLGPHVDPVPLLERYWAQTCGIEAVNERRSNAGRIAYKDYLESQFERLGAELGLIRAEKEKARKRAPLPLLPAKEFPLPDIDEFDAKALARARFEAAHADLARLQQTRLAAVQVAYASRVKEFEAGRGTNSIVLEEVSRWEEAKRDLLGSASAATVLERCWSMAWLIEDEDRRRYECGRIAVQDYVDSRYYRLSVEERLAKLQAERGKGRSPIRSRLLRFPDLDVELLETKELARARFEAENTGPATRAEQRHEAARVAYAARLQEFLAGRGSLDLLLDTSVQRLKSALAQAGKNPLTAWERHWDSCQLVEAVNRRRYREGRIAVQDYMQSRHARLEAEIGLIRARKQAR
jgi:hypothetical protein